MRGVTHFRPGLYSDATHGTAVNSAGDNVNMTTFSTADAGGHGVALCIAYLGDKSTLTAKLALQALTVAMKNRQKCRAGSFGLVDVSQMTMPPSTVQCGKFGRTASL